MKAKTLVLWMMAVLLLAFGASALADGEVQVPGPVCQVPDTIQVGEDLLVTGVDWLDENQFAASDIVVEEQVYRVSICRITNGEEQVLESQAIRPVDCEAASFRVIPFYNGNLGFDAGSYFLRIWRELTSDDGRYFYSEPVDYPFTVTGTRPAAPTIEILNNEALLGESYEVRISAPDMEDFMVQYYDRDGQPYMTGSSDSIRNGYADYSLDLYEEDVSEAWFSFQAKVNGIWSEWTDRMCFQWTVLGTLEAPNVTIADYHAGEPVTASLLSSYPADAELNWEVYRIPEEGGNGELVESRYVKVRNLDDPSVLPIAAGGLDAGSYRLTIRSFCLGYFGNQYADYTFAVTGTRPAAPSITVNPETAYPDENSWFRIAAEGMTEYEVAFCDATGGVSYSNTYQTRDSSGEERFDQWSYNEEYRLYRVRAFAGGRWSEWTDFITLQWQSRGVLADPDLVITGSRAGEPVVLTVNTDLSDYRVHIICKLYRIVNENEKEFISDSYIARYSLDGLKRIILVPYGLEAGEYCLTAYAEGNGYTSSETVNIPLPISGQRPAAPQTEVTVNGALQSGTNQVKISASGLESYTAECLEYDDWWNPDHSGGSRKAENGVAVYNCARKDDDVLTVRFRGKVNGCWSDYTDPVDLTWTTLGPAAAPSLALPAGFSAGEPVVFSFAGNDTLSDGEYLSIAISDQNGEETGGFWFDASNLLNGQMITEEFGLDSGTYTVEAVRWKTDYDESAPFTGTFTVTGERPAVPAAALSADSIYAGETVMLTARAPGLESLYLNPGSWNGANYLASGGRAVIKLRPEYSMHYYGRAQIAGCWTDSFDIGSVDIQSSDEQRLSSIVPDLANASITVGQPFTFGVEVDPRAETVTVGIVLYEVQNGEYQCLREVEYEMTVAVTDGTITLPADKFTVPGVYCLNFNAYADGYLTAYTGGYYVEAADSAPLSSGAAIILHPGEGDLVFRDLPLTISAPGAELAALKVITGEGGYVHTYEDAIPVSGGAADYTVDGSGLHPGIYTFTARAFAGGHWSGWGEAQILTVPDPADAPDTLPGFSILEAPDRVVSGRPFTIAWSPCDGAERYEVCYSIGASGAISGSVIVPAAQTSATLTIQKVPGQVQTSYEGSFNVYAIAEGKESSSTADTEEYRYFELVDSEKPTLTAPKTALLPGESVALTVAGLRANELKIRINGADKGYVSFATVDNAGTISLDFSREGTFEVQAAVRWNISSYQYGIWSDWSEPLTFTVSEDNLPDTVLTLPEGTLVIEEEAFMATDIACVIINDGCAAIGNRAFADCQNLVRVIIPASVTTISGDPFAGCTGLIIITPEGSAADTFAQEHGYLTGR